MLAAHDRDEEAAPASNRSSLPAQTPLDVRPEFFEEIPGEPSDQSAGAAQHRLARPAPSAAPLLGGLRRGLPQIGNRADTEAAPADDAVGHPVDALRTSNRRVDVSCCR